MTTAVPAELPDHLLSMQEVADYLNVSVFWVKEQVRFKRVDCTRIGKHVRFTHEQVAAIIAGREQKAIRRRQRP